MNEKTIAIEPTGDNGVTEAQISTSELLFGILEKNVSRKVVTDYYVPKNKEVLDESKKFAYTVFIRLNAKGVKFKKVNFEHCIFDNCYLNHCVFDSCNFTGCKFLGSNFHQTTFSGCNFEFATFERSQLDYEILRSEAPKAENLKMRFARSLRMNYQQIGDAKAVNEAISVELEAISIYLFKSWRSRETYYKQKYPGLLKRIDQFRRWLCFKAFDLIWGNGESIFKLLYLIIFFNIFIAGYDLVTKTNGGPLGFYLSFLQIASSLQTAPAVFLGILSPPNFTVGWLTIITGTRFVSIALLTALLIKRFSRR